MTRSIAEVCVIGAGVSGLSSAIALADQGFRVTIIASQTEAITSAAAAAFWYPFWVGDKVDHSWYRPEWALDTFIHLESFLADINSGVTEAKLVEYFPQTLTVEEIDEVVAAMWWRHVPRLEFRRFTLPNSSPLAQSNYLPNWRFKSGITFRTLVINMVHYLPYLRSLASSRGVRIQEGYVVTDDLPRLLGEFEFVVNCAGLGSRELVSDVDLKPVEGVVIRLEPNAEIQDITLVHTGAPFSKWPLYIVPRGGPERDIVIGGTFGKDRGGKPRTLSWPVTTNQEDMVREEAKSIRMGCTRLEPLIADCQPLNITVGYRPSRDPGGVRLEVDLTDFSKGRLVHNYGHGGGGVTLSWGCAYQVRDWLMRLSAGAQREDVSLKTADAEGMSEA